MATIQIKRNNSNAATKPSSLLVGELAGNLLDRSLFSSDGSNVFQFYTGTTKWFDTSGNANNANKLGGVAANSYLTGITSAMITNALGYTPYNSANFTKANIKSTLGIADWALAATKPSYTASEVGALPLSGGTISSASGAFNPLIIKGNSSYAGIGFQKTGDSASSYLVYVNEWDWRITNVNWADSKKILHSGNYSSYALPLSGGTMTGAIMIGGYTSFGVSDGIFYLGNPSYPVYVRSNGIVNINGNAVIHAGNIGSYALKTDGSNLMTGYVAWNNGSEGNDVADWNTIRGNGLKIISSSTSTSNAPSAYATALHVKGRYGFQLASIGGDTDELWFKNISRENRAWKHIAFTDSNVASATKLQTARTIWGQSFDGTGDVSGNIDPIASSSFSCGTSTNQWYSVYTMRLYAKGGSNLYLGANDSIHMSISTSGNVLIGTTTDNAYKLQVAGSAYIDGNINLNLHEITNAKAIHCHDSGTGYYVGGRNYGLGVTNGGALVYAYGATPISFYTNATERMRILGNGNVLIGTITDTIGKLQVEGDIYATAWIRTKGAAGWYSQDYGGGIYMTDANYVRVYNGKGFQVDGNVLIGNTTDRGHKLAVIRENSTMTASTLHNSALFIGSSNSVDSYGLNLWTEGSGYGFIQQGRTDEEQPRLYNLSLQPFGGNVLIGTTTDNSQRLQVRREGNGEVIGLTSNQNWTSIFYGMDNGQNWSVGAAVGGKFFFNYNSVGDLAYLTSAGDLVATGDGVFGSDARYKSKLQDLSVNLQTIANAPVFSYKWTDREDNKVHLGTTAQYWLDTNFRDAVDTSNKDFYHLNYGALGVAIGVSLAKKTVDHEERIKALEKENKELKNELKQLKQWHN